MWKILSLEDDVAPPLDRVEDCAADGLPPQLVHLLEEYAQLHGDGLALHQVPDGAKRLSIKGEDDLGTEHRTFTRICFFSFPSPLVDHHNGERAHLHLRLAKGAEDAGQQTKHMEKKRTVRGLGG